MLAMTSLALRLPEGRSRPAERHLSGLAELRLPVSQVGRMMASLWGQCYEADIRFIFGLVQEPRQSVSQVSGLDFLHDFLLATAVPVPYGQQAGSIPLEPTNHSEGALKVASVLSSHTNN